MNKDNLNELEVTLPSLEKIEVPANIWPKRMIWKLLRKLVGYILRPYNHQINLWNRKLLDILYEESEIQKKYQENSEQRFVNLSDEISLLRIDNKETQEIYKNEILSYLQQEIVNVAKSIQHVSEREYKANLDIQEKITKLSEQCSGEIRYCKNEQEKFDAQLKDRDRILGALARESARTKWRFTDYIEAQNTNWDNEQITCRLCSYSAQRGTFERKITECIFGGGKLERYVCPKCGAIFGPTKFTDKSQEELDDDYTVNYAGYHEGNVTYKEIRAFEMLNPEKEKVYLNYGCGRWSDTILQLRDEGYLIYGYEPYAWDLNNPYIITNKEQLSHMRFDGIFSNDLLEHLEDPVEELKFMKILLRTPESKMSHCTGCYDYHFEFTRFHSFFFTGDSLQLICQKAGLKIIDFVNQFEEFEFICYVFAQDTSTDTAVFDQVAYTPSGRVNEKFAKYGYNPQEYYLALHLLGQCQKKDPFIGLNGFWKADIISDKEGSIQWMAKKEAKLWLKIGSDRYSGIMIFYRNIIPEATLQVSILGKQVAEVTHAGNEMAVINIPFLPDYYEMNALLIELKINKLRSPRSVIGGDDYRRIGYGICNVQLLKEI